MQILSIVLLQASVAGHPPTGEMHFVFIVKYCVVVGMGVRMKAIRIPVRSRIGVGVMSVHRKALVG